MSFGGWETPLPDDSPFKAAINSMSDAGILCIMAAGNDAQDISNPVEKFAGKLVYPACFRFAHTITVGSIGRENIKSGLSNFSSKWVDIAAPGEKIYSTLPNNRYGTYEGTSMSAAHVSGAAAILIAAFPDETANQIKGRILRGAKNVGNNQYWGAGLLDVAKAYGIESIPEKDEPMTSARVFGEKRIILGGSSFYSHTKQPSNANGTFEYSWRSSNESVVRISGRNNPSAEITGISNGSSTITVSVTQTLQDGTKISKSDSIDIVVSNSSGSSGSSGGCNLGLFLVALLLVLPVLRTRKLW
jgi:Synergist-CTERM protein sorting domain-containing protein